MDTRQLASYAYHNCEFALAVELVQRSPATAELAGIHIKALCELDAAEIAIAVSEAYLQLYPENGELRYFLGMARYLAGQSKGVIEAAFLEAAELGYPGGQMGLAFLEAAKGRVASAIDLLNSVSCQHWELEHARKLSLFQALAADGRLEEAALELRAADKILQCTPSLLRSYWGQLCWVRLFRYQSRFDGALALVDRLLALLDSALTPRLFRNATETRRLAALRSDALNLTLPTSQAGEPSPNRQGALSSITRKPMLHSLFAYLQTRGHLGATKEDIAQNVWEESYNPLIHDDRIYKAIGRLRKILGDDLQAPRFLTQVGRSYVLTPPAGELESPGEP